MTTTDSPIKFRYEGNGSTDTFAFTGRIFSEEDLIVEILLRDDDSVVSTLTLTTDYSVTINGPSSASIVVSVPPTSLQDIQIRRALDKTQSLRLPTGTVFPAANVETALDKVTAIAQEIQDELDNTLKYPPNVSGISDVSLPSPVDGAALIFDGTTGKIAASITYISDAVAQAVEEATEGVTGTSLITATSTTSLTVTGTGEKTWTIQAGRGFALGQRLRAASDDGTKINEGRVSAYSGTTLAINVDYVSGSGTHADWNISVTGDRGAAGVGTGDMLGANNLSDVSSAATAFNTIKQPATTSATGVVELATDAEALAGTANKFPDCAVQKEFAGWHYESIVATTSGSTVELTTDIPAAAREIEVFLNGVSHNQTNQGIRVQFGDAGGYETTGYVSSLMYSTTSYFESSTTGFLIAESGQDAGDTLDGVIRFMRYDDPDDSPTFTWFASGNSTRNVSGSAAIACSFGGKKSTSQALTSIRLQVATGNFDAGAARVRWKY